MYTHICTTYSHARTKTQAVVGGHLWHGGGPFYPGLRVLDQGKPLDGSVCLSAVCLSVCLLSAVCLLVSLFAVCCLLSAVCCLLSAVCCLLSAVCLLVCLFAVCCLSVCLLSICLMSIWLYHHAWPRQCPANTGICALD
jgi:hypothetical protein